MTAYSQNGYPACVTSLLGRYLVPHSNSHVVIRKGATATCLLYVAQRWHDEIEHFHYVGGYACRSIVGFPGVYSNHASGTAIDINPDLHPLGSTPSTRLSAQVHAILNTRVDGIVVRSVIRWGGDYSGRKDSMHSEVNAPLAVVTRLAEAILNVHPPEPPPPPTVPAPTPEDLMEGIVQADGLKAEFYYTFTDLVWIKDPDHRARIMGEYAKRHDGDDIIVTTIGSKSSIEQGRYGYLSRTDPGPSVAGKEAGWDFTAHRKAYTS